MTSFAVNTNGTILVKLKAQKRGKIHYYFKNMPMSIKECSIIKIKNNKMIVQTATNLRTASFAKNKNVWMFDVTNKHPLFGTFLTLNE